MVVVCKKRRGLGKSRIELGGQVYGVHGGLFFKIIKLVFIIYIVFLMIV